MVHSVMGCAIRLATAVCRSSRSMIKVRVLSVQAIASQQCVKHYQKSMTEFFNFSVGLATEYFTQ